MKPKSLSDSAASWLRTLSTVLALFATMAAMVAAGLPWMLPVLRGDFTPGWVTAVLAVGIALAFGHLVLVTAYAGFLALLVTATRGAHKTLSWSRISECTSFGAWLLSDWRFYGAGGMQQGIRVFGFEVAVQGEAR